MVSPGNASDPASYIGERGNYPKLGQVRRLIYTAQHQPLHEGRYSTENAYLELSSTLESIRQCQTILAYLVKSVLQYTAICQYYCEGNIYYYEIYPMN